MMPSHDASIEQFASGPMAAIIGQRKAEYACQTSKLFTGQEALDWGLIDQLVSPEGKCFLGRFGTFSEVFRMQFA